MPLMVSALFTSLKYESYLALVKFKIYNILFPIQSPITHLNSQRRPVIQYCLHSKVIIPLVIIYNDLLPQLRELGLPVVLRVISKIRIHF